MSKRILSAVSSLLFLLAVLGAQAALAGEIQPQKTVIKGVASSISAHYSTDIKRTVTITPANGGREVSLELYNSSKDKWKSIAKYTTEDADSATVEITFPQENRARRTGKWRIVVAETTTAKEAVKEITLTSMNIVNQKLNSKAACIYCIEDGKAIYGKKLHKHIKQASTTKIMTATLLVQSDRYNGTTKISKKASKTPYGGVYMKKGDRYTYKSLLYCLMLPSSNAAAVATAEGLGGSVKGFAEMMNAKAEEIGLKDTHYVNPHGLDTKNHYSSAYDVSLTMAYIYPRSSAFRKAISREKYSFTTEKYKEKKKIHTTDKLHGSSEKHKGGKTGRTSGAGYCFCSVYEHGGKTYVVTVMNAKTGKKRFEDVKKLYKYIDKYADTAY